MKEREDERKDPLKSGASNNDDDGGPATDDRFFGFQRSSAAISKQGWGGWMFVSVVVILEVAFILSVLHVSNHCPLLLLRSILQIAIFFVITLDILFIIRCRQIRNKRSMPRVLAEVAKLPQENPEILAFQTSKANAFSCCGITTSVWKVIWIRFQDESIQLPRVPVSDEEEAGMYAVLVWQDQPFTVGDPLEVVLLEGDPSKALYLPFQEQCLQDAVRSIIAWSVLFLAIALYALSWTGPIYYASMSQVEAAFSWPECSISQMTMIEYYLIMLTPVILVSAFIAFRQWRVAKAINERAAEKRELEQSLLGDAEMPLWTGDGGGVHHSPDRLA
jgi:hypothetical protein